jgi:hypothetical protein
VFDAVCDRVAARIGARLAVVSGRGHTIPATGAPYDELLHGFLTESATASNPSTVGYRAGGSLSTNDPHPQGEGTDAFN